MARFGELVRGAARAARYVVEATLFLPLDLLSVRIRDRVIPRAVKKRTPFLSCRRYGSFGPQPLCGPLMKYSCRAMFALVCRRFDASSGECRRVT